jgi:lipoprotein-anchoring transpeptidase ErfK/SrfK
MAQRRHGPRRRHRALKIAAIAVGVLGVLGGGTAYAAYRYDAATSDRILPGIAIDGVPVGGMARDEAISAVRRRAGAELGGPLTVSAADRTWTVTPAALGMRADVAGAVDRAFALADDLSFVSRVWHRAREIPLGARIGLTYVYDDQAIQSFVQDAYQAIHVSAVDARVALVDDQVVMRKAQQGRDLLMGGSIDRIRTALEQRSSSVALPVKTVEPAVRNRNVGKSIVVDLSDNTLTLYDAFKVEKEYPVATAMPGYTTPVGTWKIVNKVENPTWYNPAPDTWGAGEPLVIPPGPGNPLGTRALYLNAPGIRIHGTYASYSIGTHASHGCIRMYISDSEELYPLVPIGTRVLIKP